MTAPRNRRHILVPNAPSVEKYTPHGGGGPTATPGAPPVGRPDHAALLNASIESAVDESAVRQDAVDFGVPSAKLGVYLTFESLPGWELAVASSESKLWEIWLRRTDGKELERLYEFAAQKNIKLGQRRLEFDDRIVVLAFTSPRDLFSSLDVLNDFAELQRAKELATFFVQQAPRTKATGSKTWWREVSMRPMTLQQCASSTLA